MKPESMADIYKRAHRDHIKHQRLGRVALVTGILGLLSLFISFIFFSIGALSRNTNTDRVLFLSAVYLAAGLGLLAVRAMAQFIHHRMAPRRRGADGAAKEDFYRYPPSRRRRGAALVIVLGILALITLLVAHAQINAVHARKRDHALLLKARLQTAAADAVRDALRRLAADEDLTVDHTNETWAISREIQDPAGITAYVKVTDENRFFNINNLTAAPRSESRPPASIVMDLLTLCGDLTPVERVDALLDWMDEDDQGHFESRYFKDMKIPYGPAHAPLRSWGEWPHVPGFHRDYFRRHERQTIMEAFSANVVDTLAVVPGRRNAPEPVNINTAGHTVLTGVLGLENEGIVALIIGVRNLRPIRSLEELGGVLPPDLLPRVHAYLDTKSRYFTVHAWAYAEGRTERLYALVERNGEGDVQILRWVM